MECGLALLNTTHIWLHCATCVTIPLKANIANRPFSNSWDDRWESKQLQNTRRFLGKTCPCVPNLQNVFRFKQHRTTSSTSRAPRWHAAPSIACPSPSLAPVELKVSWRLLGRYEEIPMGYVNPYDGRSYISSPCIIHSWSVIQWLMLYRYTNYSTNIR